MNDKYYKNLIMEYKSIEWYEERLSEYQHLQGLVLTFPQKYKDELSLDLQSKFNKHFGIQRQREGRIEQPMSLDTIDWFNLGIQIKDPYPPHSIQ